jgi:FkbM family methyltransferase
MEYYSQSGQDAFVLSYFNNKTNGVFIDIGANDGITFSNTYYFEKNLNWSGICIEPIPKVFESLDKNRNCIKINAAISNKKSIEKFAIVDPIDMLSGLYNEYDPKHLEKIHNNGWNITELNIQCLVLNDILEEYKIFHIDYLSIDTEGNELKILESINFDKFNIDLIDVENNYDNEDLRNFIISKGYILIEKIGCDEIYSKIKNIKIIQSFAQYNEDNHYVGNELNGTEKYLNFYTFLLSFLTLKKYYGSVTMYCNRLAYDTFIKYIPYDNVIIIENKNTIDWWSAYKLDIISIIDEPFIHVDSDVFIFDDIFRPFINNKDYDIIVQNSFDIEIIDKEKWIFEICPIQKIKNKSFLCGVIGFNDINKKEKYIKNTKKVKKLIENNLIIGDYGFILEEYTLYLTTVNDDLKYFEVLPYDDIKDIYSSGEKNNYTHMWFASKYVKTNIDLIKNKIKKDFSEYYEIVEKYDNLISKYNIKYYKI